jgi:hypothetical protein
MMKRVLAIALLAGSLGASAQDGKLPAAKSKAEAAAEAVNYEVVGAPMPPFYLVTLDTMMDNKQERKAMKNTPGYLRSAQNTKVYSDKYFDNKANLMVMMFNPTCGHCEDQTERFKKDIGKFRNTRLILLANQQMKQYLPNFIANHETVKYADKMYVGYDSTDFIKKTFLYQALPQINIYNADRKLIRTFSGNVSMDTLAQYIQ